MAREHTTMTHVTAALERATIAAVAVEQAHRDAADRAVGQAARERDAALAEMRGGTDD